MAMRSLWKLARAAAVAWLALLAASAAHAVDAGEHRRVVAVGGSITEIIFALGEQDRLIARDSTSVFPQDALDLPDVGYMRALSPEGVLSVDPDLIIALEGSGPPDAIEVLAKASIPMIMVPERFDRQGIVEKVRVVGDALGVAERAEQLAARVDADIAAAQAAAEGAGPRPRVLFVLSMQSGRILASGASTAASGVIALAGADNAITAYEGYRQLTDEAVIEAAPDVILMMDRGGAHDAQAAELFAHPAIAPTPAARNHAIVRMDGAFLLGFGPRTAEAVRELAEALHGLARAD